jgi:hypothetical protein
MTHYSKIVTSATTRRQKLHLEDFLQFGNTKPSNTPRSAMFTRHEPNKVFNPTKLKANLIENKKLNISTSTGREMNRIANKPNLGNIVRTVKNEFAHQK